MARTTRSASSCGRCTVNPDGVPAVSAASDSGQRRVQVKTARWQPCRQSSREPVIAPRHVEGIHHRAARQVAELGCTGGRLVPEGEAVDLSRFWQADEHVVQRQRRQSVGRDPEVEDDHQLQRTAESRAPSTLHVQTDPVPHRHLVQLPSHASLAQPTRHNRRSLLAPQLGQHLRQPLDRVELHCLAAQAETAQPWFSTCPALELQAQLGRQAQHMGLARFDQLTTVLCDLPV